MNKIVLLLVGFLLISAGVLTGVYVILNKAEQKEQAYPFDEKLKLGEELLNQSGKKSATKALQVYSEITSKTVPDAYKFRANYGLANALQRNKDKLRALEMYRELNQLQNLSKEEKELVSYSLGSLLLLINQEEEGRTHLDEVLKMSKDHKLRSKTFLSIADHYARNMKLDLANKNYLQSIEEYPNNVNARIGWIRTLRKLGRDFVQYDSFEEFTESDKTKVKPIKEVEVKKDKTISFDKAKTYFNQKEYSKASSAFKKILGRNLEPKDRERALYYISESNLRMGKFKEAISYAEKILVNEPATLDRYAHYIKGLSFYGMKQYDKAATSFTTVVDKFEPSSITENSKAYYQESLRLYKEFLNSNEKKDSDKKETSIEEEPEEDLTTP
jgi:tetratricopeptide (TPR) repeat protein